MDKQQRKKLKEQYQNMTTYMGVVQIQNQKNGKIYLDAFPNLKNRWFTLQMQLDKGRFANAELQQDWTELGAENFTYSILQEESTKDVADVRWEVDKMLKKWLGELQPFDVKGYNKRK